MTEGAEKVTPKMTGTEEHRRSPETRDLSVPGILLFFLAVVLLIVFTFASTRGLFTYLSKRESEPPSPHPQISRVRRLPEGPRLQVNPSMELRKMRESEEKRLGSYGWIDREKGIVRIPIDRAIELLSERGLPVRKNPPPQVEESKP